MAEKIVKQLLVVLHQDYEYYQNLQQLAIAKEEAIINNNVEQLAKLVKKDRK